MRFCVGLMSLTLLCGQLIGSSPALADDTTAKEAQAPAAVATPEAPAAVAVPDLSGCWSGTWCSHKNGHHGPMKATFTHLGNNCYEVCFKGRFMAVLPFSYKTNLQVTHGSDGTAYLTGHEHLPLFGDFTMSAAATDCQFVSNFCAKRDHGVFNLTRVCR